MGITSEHTIQYRYPGTKFFESYQQAIFFGREREANELIDSIKAYDVFVIFADSGIGKTSLLNAALIPRMEKENMLPIKVRFQDVPKPPLQAIFQQLAPYTNDAGQPAASSIVPKLWRLFKSCHFNNRLPVLVFDQFEEFFNHAKLLRESCTNELADLVNEYLPDYIKEEMRMKFKEKDPTPEEQKYYAPARLEMLFLIRADKLTLMDDMSKKMPLILRNRYHLKPLTVKQAEQAIVLPPLLPQKGFASPPFNFQEEAITDICHYLVNEEGEVESFQLQILCQELEKRILERYERKEKSLWLSKEELGGEAGMDSITKNYYNNQLASITDEAMRKKAIDLIEDKLIVEDRRISLPEDFLIKEGYSKTLLDYLQNTTRLIRVYNERDSRYFEISHDRLIPSILKSKEQRQEEEEKLNQQRNLQRLKEEQEEKSRQMQKEKEEEKKDMELQFWKEKDKKNRKLRRLTYTLIVLVFLLLFAIFYSYQANVLASIADASFAIEKQEFDKADSILKRNQMLGTFFHFKANTIQDLNDMIRIQNQKKKQYYFNISTGDSLAASNDKLFITTDSLINLSVSPQRIGRDLGYRKKLLNALGYSTLLEAKNYYLKAKSTGFKPYKNPDEVGQKINNIDLSLSYSFGQCIKATSIFITIKDTLKAQEAFKKAQHIFSLNPSVMSNNVETYDRLQKTLNK